MDGIELYLSGCTVEDISGILGPYLRDRIQRDSQFQDGLGISARPSHRSISTKAAVTSGANGPTPLPTHRPPFSVFEVILNEYLNPEALDKLCIDFLAHTPREHVVCFEADMRLGATKKIIVTMPNVRELHLTNVTFPERFLQPDPDGPLSNAKLLPSLRCLRLKRIDADDWSPFARYLAHQTSGG